MVYHMVNIVNYIHCILEKNSQKLKKKKIMASSPISSVQVSYSVMSNSSNPVDMPGFLVHHQLPELAQTHVHRVGDATQPSHPLSSPSHPAFNLSQHQGLLQWVSSSHQVAKVLELQHQFFQWIFMTGLISLKSKELSRVFSNTTVQKHQFLCTRSHHFMANRRGKSGSSDSFYFLALKNHCGQWLQPWN